MHIFHMVFLRTRRHLTQLRHLAGELIDITHGEVDFCFLRRRQQMQDGIGGTAHGDIQRHGVFKSRLAGDIARQRGSVILLVIAFGQLDDTFTGVQEQLLTIGVGRQQRAVTRLRQAQRFGQAVHGVRREHPGTGAAGRQATLYLIALLVGHFRIRPLNHRIHQVKLDDFI